MQGWAELSKDPSKLQELMASMRNDPEVMAKAQEMLKDPAYMQAPAAPLSLRHIVFLRPRPHWKWLTLQAEYLYREIDWEDTNVADYHQGGWD